MSRKERTERARNLFSECRGMLLVIATELSYETDYTFDECYEHLVEAVVDESEKLLGGGR